MPEKVPLWVIQNTFMSWGDRWPKRSATLPDDPPKICETCGKELPNYVDWNYCNELYYCNAHIGAAREAQSKVWAIEREQRKAEWERKDQERSIGYRPPSVLLGPLPAVPRTEAEVPAGNLDAGLYQYWIGSDDSKSPFRNIMTTRAVCRACGEVVHGALGRSIHQRDSHTYYAGDYSCMKVIQMAIRNMVALTNCMVCKAYTSKKHYGVPICSPNCHKIWRFAEKMQYPALDLAIAPFWISTANIAETGGSTTSESSSNPLKLPAE